jgi:hypothetical protein
MSLHSTPINTGRLRGVVYDFDIVGDALPMHRHREDDVHITIVARGSVRAHGPEIGDNIYHAGAVLDWAVDVDHEIVAMSDGARVVNILKN